MLNIRIILSVFWCFLAMALISSCDEELEKQDPAPPLSVSVGEDKQVIVGDLVILQAALSGNGSSFETTWSMLASPTESQSAIAVFDRSKATLAPDVEGTYRIRITVADGGRTATDEVIITVRDRQAQTIVLTQPVREPMELLDIFEDPAIADYLVTEDLYIESELSVNPGVTIQFAAGTGMIVRSQGSLVAVGTSENRIHFIGTDPTKGFWKGILVQSNNVKNMLLNVAIGFAGSNSFAELVDGKSAITLEGDLISGASLSISATTIHDSGGHGLLVLGASYLGEFQNNTFLNNTSSGIAMPANEAHKIDFNSHFNGNGFDGVEVRGSLHRHEETTWTGFNDGSGYFIAEGLLVRSGLTLRPGATLAIDRGQMIHVSPSGYLRAIGNAASPIVFKSALTGENWRGLLFESSDTRNALIHCQVFNGGSDPLPGLANKGNVGIAELATVLIDSCSFGDGAGFGIVAATANQLGPTTLESNFFVNLFQGNIFPIPQGPLPTLAGDWVDYWSFTNGRYSVDVNFYSPEDSKWFHGATDPWSTPGPAGFGLHIDASGAYTWAIAERHSFEPQCLSFSAEHIVGTLQSDETHIDFFEGNWRTRYENSCAPEEAVDMAVTPGTMRLRYQITKAYNVWTGEPYWELKLFRPDNSFFSLYRK